MSEKPIQPKDTPEVDLGNEAGSRAMEQALRSSFTILKLVIAVLAVYLVFSNTFSVDENTEGAIVLRFGQAQTEDRAKVFEAGIRFAWPYPIDEKVEIAREKPVKSDTAWYAAMGAVQIGDNPNQRPVDASRDGYALTQDGKIIHLQAEMIYQVADPSQFAFGYADAVAVLQLVLDNSVTYAASQKNLGEIQKNPTLFASSVQQRANDLVDQYDLGVEVVRVTMGGDDVELPFLTRNAHNASKSAESQAREALSAAAGEAKNIRDAINTEAGEIATIRNQANNQAQALSASVGSLAQRFTDIIEKYPTQQTRRRYMEQMYYEAMERIAENEDIKIYLVSKGGKLNPAKLRLLINQPPPEVEDKEGGN